MPDTTRLQGIAPRTLPVEQPSGRRDVEKANPTANAGGTPFAELLRSRQGLAPQAPATSDAPPVRFSAHAQTRLNSRNITLDAGHLDRLQGAVQRAAGKGSRDALVLMDDLAMVVSVTNRTVVTVVDKDNLKQNVFTNIDSAVIA
ncbi:MAG TPA: TIGR02530 family flagellar biosynthesis protein [Chthonomonadaceae bacterium]|nr:TIGR02530 family flagellar biosynthesis protein [Chthonomonadaceae bacterium]